MSALSTLKLYPEPDWESPNVIIVDDKEELPDGQALLELAPTGHDQSDDSRDGDFVDHGFWLDDVSWIEKSVTVPTSVSIAAIDRGPDAFEDVLDPALFCSEGSVS